MPAKLTAEEVEARLAGRDLVMLEEYKNNHTKTLFGCRCGYKWLVKPNDIFQGHGCPVCQQEKAAKTQTLTLKDLQPRLTKLEKRGITMLDEYKGMQIDTLFRCKCRHEWTVKAYSVLNGGGCPKCADKTNAEKRRLTADELQPYLKDIAERGIVMLEEYKGVKHKALFQCKCGCKWMAKTFEVFFRASGCPKCSYKKRGEARWLTSEELQPYSSKLAARGLTMLGEFKGTKAKTLFRCTCGHEWMTKPNDIFQGHGCPECAEFGFQMDKPGLVYYVKIPNPFGDPLYKIGITNHTVKKRFPQEFKKLEIIEIWNFKMGAKAWEMEQRILRDYAAYRYNGPTILIAAGNEEVFSEDILGLDNEHKGQNNFPF
jgi:hypothetical protein